MRFPSDTRGSSPLILFLISVLLRCLPHRLLENGAEIMRIVVSDTLSDLTSTQLRSPQEDTGLFDPRFRQVFDEVFPRFLLENRTEITRADPDMRRYLIQGKILLDL